MGPQSTMQQTEILNRNGVMKRLLNFSMGRSSYECVFFIMENNCFTFSLLACPIGQRPLNTVSYSNDRLIRLASTDAASTFRRTMYSSIGPGCHMAVLDRACSIIVINLRSLRFENTTLCDSICYRTSDIPDIVAGRP